MMKSIEWFIVIVVLKDSGVKLQPSDCDQSRRGAYKEGVLGSVHSFPWLGVLRVHLHDETSLKLALTGIVLVKEKYAIGNADDIAKIPKRVFQEDSQAMFIPAERAPWFCRVVDYMTHPEYELDTLNSLALIELEPPETNFPMKPVCWPAYTYNTSNNLYAVGYTDDNQLLEKFIHKLQYVDQDLCKEFYSRAGLAEGMKTPAPAHYECGFALNNKDSCVWENGMALVSNSSGLWVLIGLGLQGPGCAAPARFISISHYYSWIESATDVQEIEDHDNYRKSAYNEGSFKKSKKPVVEYIPAHELLRSSSSIHEDQGEHVKHEFAHYHPYDVLIHNEDPFQIQRISGTEIHVNFNRKQSARLGSYGNCNDKDLRMIYKDYINVTLISHSNFSAIQRGIVQYKMTLHDSMFLKYTCVTIKLHVLNTKPAFLYYDTIMKDGTIFPENPEEIIRHYPFHTLTKLVTKNKTDHLMPNPIKSEAKNLTWYNVNLYLKISFQDKCRLEFRFFGPPDEVPTGAVVRKTTLTTTPKPTTTFPAKDPYAGLRKYIPLEFEEHDNGVFKEDRVYNGACFTNSIRVWFITLVLVCF